VHTGQHYDFEMSRAFFEELEIPEPEANLGVGSGSHAEQLGRTLVAVEKLLEGDRPDLVLVFGDTNSTLGAALAAARLGIPLGHVEAGVRGHNLREPEEQNRVLTDRLADLLFVPTADGVENLAREGIAHGVHRVGDVMLDLLIQVRARHGDGADRVRDLGLEPRRYALATFHRPANVDRREPLAEILEALGSLGVPAVLPLHPRTRARVQAFGLLPAVETGVRVLPPLGYLTTLALTAHARVVLTDSGGLQKEAYLLETPCVTVGTQTAWVETVRSGWNRLVPPRRSEILRACEGFRGGSVREPFYGDGTASERIGAIVASFAR
jgi:UDP-N-acetylglucosamine 2-epimerase